MAQNLSGDELRRRARESMTDGTPEVAWFRDLAEGKGRAEALPRRLRDVLQISTGDVASAAAEKVKEARVAAQRRQREEATRAAEARDRAAAERRSMRVRSAWRSLWPRLGGGALLWLFTPVAASFATVIPGLNLIAPIVFFGSETGSTSGDGPWTLYVLLAWAVGGLIAVLFIVDVRYGGSDAEMSLLFGFALGIIVIYVACGNGIYSGALWFVGPAVGALSYWIQGRRRT